MQGMRYMVMDFLNITPKEQVKTYRLMNTGFSQLDEKSSVQTSEKTYIGDKVATSNIKGIKTEFPFSTDIYTDEETVMFVRSIFRNQKTGDECVTTYVRTDISVDGYGVPLQQSGPPHLVPAREFSVSVLVDSETGGGGEMLTLSGKLLQRGDFVDGMFNLETGTFVPA